MTTKTDPNQNYTIKEFYIKVKGDKTRCCDNGGKLLQHQVGVSNLLIMIYN